MEQVKVIAKKHTDIRGKDLLYLIVSKGEKDVIINVGEKTFKAVAELILDGMEINGEVKKAQKEIKVDARKD